MAFPIRECVKCGEEYELKPNHAGYANRCPQCNEPEEDAGGPRAGAAAFEGKREADAARRQAIKDMLYPGR
jgi:hypothetical protein